jgi:hypothetical protein
MDNALVTELRSLSAAALTATTAAERGNWQEAKTCTSDVCTRAERVCRQLTSTEHELRGDGDSHTRDGPPQCDVP